MTRWRWFLAAAFVATIATPMTLARMQFRAAVDSVSIDVSVKAGNAPVLGLTAADFLLADNGVPQTIQAIALDAVPIDATLLLDTSRSLFGSQANLKSDIAEMAAFLRPADRLRVLVFDDQIRDVFGWRPAGTLDVAAVLQRVGVGEHSSVYDGLVLALIHRPDPDRRHLVIAMTDGRDGGSVADSKLVRDVARRAESVLHLVMVGGNTTGLPRNGAGARLALWPTMPDFNGDANLNEAAKLTGGRVHGGSFPGAGVDTVKAFKTAFDDFRQSYILRYTLTGVAREGWHDVKVEVRKPGKLTIRSRRGYFR
jgi:VWFA-related protein